MCPMTDLDVCRSPYLPGVHAVHLGADEPDCVSSILGFVFSFLYRTKFNTTWVSISVTAALALSLMMSKCWSLWTAIDKALAWLRETLEVMYLGR